MAIEEVTMASVTCSSVGLPVTMRVRGGPYTYMYLFYLF